MSAAVECIRGIFPQSAVKTVRLDKFPQKVTIKTDAFSKPHNVWSGKQANLFEKYPKRRRKAMEMIRTSLADLKETLMCGLGAATTDVTTSATQADNNTNQSSEGQSDSDDDRKPEAPTGENPVLVDPV